MTKAMTVPSFANLKKGHVLPVAAFLAIFYLVYAFSNTNAFTSSETIISTFSTTTTTISDKIAEPLSSPTCYPSPAPVPEAPAADSEEEYVAFCVAHRNQRQDLPEFFKHHYHHHGIRRFYIMDDRSWPPLSTFSDYGIPRSALSFQFYDKNAQHPKMQTHIYAECARLYGAHHTWMAFVDADEFFEARRKHETLTSILRELEQEPHIGALGVNWRLHSSANLTTRPDSVRKGFTRCPVDPPEIVTQKTMPKFSDSRMIKSIVRTALFEYPLTPHLFRTRNGTWTVGEKGDRIPEGNGLRQPITRERIALHHYTLKSREQFREKTTQWTDKGWEYWDHIEGLNQTFCGEMAKYNP